MGKLCLLVTSRSNPGVKSKWSNMLLSAVFWLHNNNVHIINWLKTLGAGRYYYKADIAIFSSPFAVLLMSCFNLPLKLIQKLLEIQPQYLWQIMKHIYLKLSRGSLLPLDPNLVGLLNQVQAKTNGIESIGRSINSCYQLAWLVRQASTNKSLTCEYARPMHFYSVHVDLDM